MTLVWPSREQLDSYADAMLPEAAGEGLRYVEITTGVGNDASRRVIGKNGGVLIGEFVTPASLGSKRELRYRVSFDDTHAD